MILTDPAVENLSSFIGIDGTNTTLNSGRILINLKPLADRKISATDVIRRLQPHLAEVAGITLFMQPVQDLTVEDRVSRTQFQYTLEDPNADELNTYAPKMLARLRELPQLTDVATDQQVQGLRARLVFDRDTASRLGITPSAIDQTLYDAYGQREVSTIFTQLNQYHVVLEVKPEFRQNPVRPAQSLHPYRRRNPSAAAGLVAGGSVLHRSGHQLAARAATASKRNCRRSIASSTAFPPAARFRSAPLRTWKPSRPHHRQPSGPVPRHHALLQSGPQRFAGRCGGSREQGQGGDRLAAQHSGRVSRYRPGVSGIAGQ